MHSTITCRTCKEEKSTSDYAKHAIKLRTCRTCSKKLLGQRRGQGDLAQRLLFNLKCRCKEQGLIEGKLWRKCDVEKLLEAFQFPESVELGIQQGLARPKLRLVRIDGDSPWLPSNTKVVI